jgi:hypothetical protein
MIKNIFYLSYNVKLQFFKSFILPYFDYCSSLAIYLNKYNNIRLAKCYYFCLKKLFGYSFVDEKTNEKTKQLEEVTWSLDRINTTLEKDRIFSLEYRIVYKIILFIHE